MRPETPLVGDAAASELAQAEKACTEGLAETVRLTTHFCETRAEFGEPQFRQTAVALSRSSVSILTDIIRADLDSAKRHLRRLDESVQRHLPQQNAQVEPMRRVVQNLDKYLRVLSTLANIGVVFANMSQFLQAALVPLERRLQALERHEQNEQALLYLVIGQIREYAFLLVAGALILLVLGVYSLSAHNASVRGVVAVTAGGGTIVFVCMVFLCDWGQTQNRDQRAGALL